MASTRTTSIAVTALVVLLTPPPRVACGERITTEEIVDAGRLSDIVAVRDVRTKDGEVSGELVNRSSGRLRNVRLMITHAWLWTNEMHPGIDGPGQTVYVTIPDEIPPGGRVSFTYRPEEPLRLRPDGHFETTVEVVGLEKFPV